MSRERPIIFKAPLVRAILDGQKTVTRRVLKFHDPDRPRLGHMDQADGFATFYDSIPDDPAPLRRPCPQGAKGDRLWVRETWAIKDCGARVGVGTEHWPDGFPVARLQYMATDTSPVTDKGKPYWWNSRSPIHMARWASRIDLEITNVRPERLHEMEDHDDEARLEGMTGHGQCMNPADEFRLIWDEINGKSDGCDWKSNPWVWRIEFRVVKP